MCIRFSHQQQAYLYRLPDWSFALTTNGIFFFLPFVFLVYQENLIHFCLLKFGSLSWLVSCRIGFWFPHVCYSLEEYNYRSHLSGWPCEINARCHRLSLLHNMETESRQQVVTQCCALSCVMPSALPLHQGPRLEAWGSQVALAVSISSSYMRSGCSYLQMQAPKLSFRHVEPQIHPVLLFSLWSISRFWGLCSLLRGT